MKHPSTSKTPGHNLATLLFQWPIKKTPRLSLPLCILFAALLHLSTIYLFNIVYQSPHVSKPVAAQVFFLLPGSSASQQLTAWLKANDSSIFSALKTTEEVRPKVSSDIYEPRQPTLPLRLLPPLKKKSVEPPTLPTSETVLPMRERALASNSSSSFDKKNYLPSCTTTVQLLENLSTRQPLPPLSLGCPPLPNEITTPLSPTELTVNIDSRGIPRHAIILESSGNSVADETATRWLMSCRFAPANEETWGNLLILWGNSDSVEKKSSTPQPLTPSTLQH